MSNFSTLGFVKSIQNPCSTPEHNLPNGLGSGKNLVEKEEKSYQSMKYIALLNLMLKIKS